MSKVDRERIASLRTRRAFKEMGALREAQPLVFCCLLLILGGLAPPITAQWLGFFEDSTEEATTSVTPTSPKGKCKRRQLIFSLFPTPLTSQWERDCETLQNSTEKPMVFAAEDGFGVKLGLLVGLPWPLAEDRGRVSTARLGKILEIWGWNLGRVQFRVGKEPIKEVMYNLSYKATVMTVGADFWSLIG